MTTDRSPRRINSVDNAFQILELLRDADGMALSALAEELDLSPGTVHTYLSTMEQRGYVRRIDSEYHVGLFVLPLGEYVRGHSPLYHAAKPEVDQLANNTGEAIHVVVESNSREIVLYGKFGEEAVGEDYHMKNKEYPAPNLHCSAAGKAMLAHMDRSRREAVLDEYDLSPRTNNTITSREKLNERLDSVREEGIARNDEEQVEGLRAVAAPIHRDGTVIAAISFSAPTSRLRGERFQNDVPDQLAKTANIIEVELQTK